MPIARTHGRIVVNRKELEFYDEIEYDDLFEGNNPRERIMIFRLTADQKQEEDTTEYLVRLERMCAQ